MKIANKNHEEETFCILELYELMSTSLKTKNKIDSPTVNDIRKFKK